MAIPLVHNVVGKTNTIYELSASQDMEIPSDVVYLDSDNSGAARTCTIYAKGTTNIGLRFNSTTSAWEFSNDGSKYISTKQFSDRQEPTGFVNRNTTLSWDNGTRTLTITGDHTVYINGIPYAKTTAQIIISPGTSVTGLYFVYYDQTGTLTHSTTFPGFFLPLVASVYWNAATSKGLVSDERHGIAMDGATHEYLHDTVGCRYESGLSLTVPTNSTFSMSAGVIHDEDIDQPISAATTCDVFYFNGSSAWAWDAASTALYGAGVLYYNNGTTKTATPNNQFSALWVFATTAASGINSPIAVVIGQRVDVSLANAQANNTYNSLSLGTLPGKEWKLLYRVIYKNAGGTPTWQSTDDYRSVSNLSTGNYVATQHSTLAGLTSDDHTQYALLAGRTGGQTFVGLAENSPVLTISKTSANSGDLLTIAPGASATGNALKITQAGNADAINIALSHTGAQGIVINESTTGAQAVIYVYRPTSVVSGLSFLYGTKPVSPIALLDCGGNVGVTTPYYGLYLSSSYEPSEIADGSHFSPSITWAASAWSDYAAEATTLSVSSYIETAAASFPTVEWHLRGMAAYDTTGYPWLCIKSTIAYNYSAMGIGNDAPLEYLHVGSAGYGSGHGGSGICMETDGQCWVCAKDAGTSGTEAETFIMSSGTAGYAGTFTAHDFILRTNDTNRWTINATTGQLSAALGTSANSFSITQSTAYDAINISCTATGAQALVVASSVATSVNLLNASISNNAANGNVLYLSHTGTGDCLSVAQNYSGDGIYVSKGPGSSMAGHGVSIAMGTYCTGNAININNSASTGLGNSIYVTGAASAGLILQYNGLLTLDASMTTSPVAVVTQVNNSTFTSNVMEIVCDRAASTSTWKFLRMFASGTDPKWAVWSDGTTHADGAYSSSGEDYAEYVESQDEPTAYEAGDVCVISGNDVYDKSSIPNDRKIAGVYSSNPIVIGNSTGDGYDRASGTLETETWELLSNDKRTGEPSRFHKIGIDGNALARYTPGSAVRIGDTLVEQIAAVEYRAEEDKTHVTLSSSLPMYLSSATKDLYYGLSKLRHIPLGMLGRIVTKCVTESGSIAPGDLLVTSSLPGHAMKAGADAPRGTILGKSLGTLTDDGSGTVAGLVMAYVNLQ